jgi:hypothetical protein
MVRLLTACALSLAIALAAGGCGGGDDETTSGGGATSVGSASYDITAQKFIASTEKMQILEDFAADHPECKGAIDEGFLLDISARATNLPPDAPIADEILDACTPQAN